MLTARESHEGGGGSCSSNLVVIEALPFAYECDGGFLSKSCKRQITSIGFGDGERW